MPEVNLLNSQPKTVRDYDKRAQERTDGDCRMRKEKYARMVGITLEQLEQLREHSKNTSYRFFPDYDGPLSFEELYSQPGLFRELEPVISQALY
jgi:hypothetical protein